MGSRHRRDLPIAMRRMKENITVANEDITAIRAIVDLDSGWPLANGFRPCISEEMCEDAKEYE